MLGQREVACAGVTATLKMPNCIAASRTTIVKLNGSRNDLEKILIAIPVMRIQALKPQQSGCSWHSSSGLTR
jgi:hypothetical protein